MWNKQYILNSQKLWEPNKQHDSKWHAACAAPAVSRHCMPEYWLHSKEWLKKYSKHKDLNISSVSHNAVSKQTLFNCL